MPGAGRDAKGHRGAAASGGRERPSLPVRRTPAPYRPRPGQRDPMATWMWGGLSAFVAVLVVLGVLATRSHPPQPTPEPVPTGAIDGITCDPIPAAAASSSTAAAGQIQVHLDIFIAGKAMNIPAGTGIYANAGCQYWLRASAANGVITVAPPVTQTFTLGDFFDIWGLPLTATDLAGHQAGTIGGTATEVRAYVNGKAQAGDPRQIPLAAGDEIVLAYGPPWKTPVPAAYTFTAGTGS